MVSGCAALRRLPSPTGASLLERGRHGYVVARPQVRATSKISTDTEFSNASAG